MPEYPWTRCFGLVGEPLGLRSLMHPRGCSYMTIISTVKSQDHNHSSIPYTAWLLLKYHPCQPKLIEASWRNDEELLLTISYDFPLSQSGKSLANSAVGLSASKLYAINQQLWHRSYLKQLSGGPPVVMHQTPTGWGFPPPWHTLVGLKHDLRWGRRATVGMDRGGPIWWVKWGHLLRRSFRGDQAMTIGKSQSNLETHHL